MSCIGALGICIYLFMLYYLESTTIFDEHTWHIDAITASDYTIELRIEPTMWKEFLNTVDDVLEDQPSMAVPSIDEIPSLANKFASYLE